MKETGNQRASAADGAGAQPDWGRLGFLRVAAWAPVVDLADPDANAARMIDLARRSEAGGAALVLFPELSLTGYSCEDLFLSAVLERATRRALAHLVADSRGRPALRIVGAPCLLPDGRRMNAAWVIRDGAVLAIVPKQRLANHGEFQESRWFEPGPAEPGWLEDPVWGRVPFGGGLVLRAGDVGIGVEICEDLWAPDSPGERLAVAGAQLVCNLSASNELAQKADWRRDLVRVQSGRMRCAYLYASAGPTESTRDAVFGGHLLLAENGSLIAESDRFALDDVELCSEVDVERLAVDRARDRTFAGLPRPLHTHVPMAPLPGFRGAPRRSFEPLPFVPADPAERQVRAREILAIQATGLARRLRSIAADTRMVVGLSGGLDSTLALLVALEAGRRLGQEPERVLAVTMPGPGTGTQTRANVSALVAATGVELREIPIHAAVELHLADLRHEPGSHDVVFENAQARERTQLLFNLANQVGGIVVGTGDLSELALGWATFNGDHMSNYGVNAGVPKTLVRYLVEAVASESGPELRAALEAVVATPISPELLPSATAGEIGQSTEELVGPYELHDFFLYHMLRFGSGPQRLLAMATRAFAGQRSPDEIRRWLRLFLQRFFRQQFKRSTLPPGPKVGTVSLSPRGDWRMPDEAIAEAWLRELDASPAIGAGEDS